MSARFSNARILLSAGRIIPATREREREKEKERDRERERKRERVIY